MTHTELINSPDYEKIEELQISDVKTFVKRELSQSNKWTTIVALYQSVALLLIGFLLFKAFMPFIRTGETAFLQSMAWAALFSFSLLIVIHELLHYFAFLLVGVRRLSFGMKLKKFIFYVQADKEVVNYRQMKIVALAPLLVVAVVTSVTALLFLGQTIYFFCLTIFAIHSLFCAGDLGILSFFENRPGDEIVSYDDKEKQIAYFYKKTNEDA